MRLATNIPMTFLSEETFGPFLFASDDPILVVYGESARGSTRKAIGRVRRILQLFPRRVRTGFLSKQAAVGLAPKLGLHRGPVVMLYQDGHLRCCLSGGLSGARLFAELCDHMHVM